MNLKCTRSSGVGYQLQPVMDTNIGVGSFIRVKEKRLTKMKFNEDHEWRTITDGGGVHVGL